MKLLLINTTTSDAGVVLFENESSDSVLSDSTKITQASSENYFRHSESLLPAIEEVLNKAELTLSELSAISVITGPGSFTGIRVGLATVKAFFAALNVNVLSANMFEVLAGCVNTGIVLMQSTNTSFYYGVIENETIVDYGVISSENLDEFLNSHNKLVFCFNDELQEVQKSYNNIETINNINNIFYEFFANEFNNKNFKNVKTIEPFYIQLSQAERELKEKEEKNS